MAILDMTTSAVGCIAPSHTPGVTIGHTVETFGDTTELDLVDVETPLRRVEPAARRGTRRINGALIVQNRPRLG